MQSSLPCCSSHALTCSSPLLFPQTSGGIEETFFKSLDDLIRHYKRKNQGLAMHLRHSVKRKTALLIRHQSTSQSPPEPMSPSPREPEMAAESLFEEHDYESTFVLVFLSYSQRLVCFMVCLTFSSSSARCPFLWICWSPTWRRPTGRMTDEESVRDGLEGHVWTVGRRKKRTIDWMQFRIMNEELGQWTSAFLDFFRTHV